MVVGAVSMFGRLSCPGNCCFCRCTFWRNDSGSGDGRDSFPFFRVGLYSFSSGIFGSSSSRFWRCLATVARGLLSLPGKLSKDGLLGRSVVLRRVGEGESSEVASTSGLFRLLLGETSVLGGGVGVCMVGCGSSAVRWKRERQRGIPRWNGILKSEESGRSDCLDLVHLMFS